MAICLDKDKLSRNKKPLMRIRETLKETLTVIGKYCNTVMARKTHFTIKTILSINWTPIIEALSTPAIRLEIPQAINHCNG